MKVGYIQNTPVFGNKEKNFEEIRSLSKGIKADLLVLSELFATGYTFTSKEECRELAETTSGKTATFLKKLSIETGATIIAGFVELENDKIYNSLLIVSGNEVIDTYRKIHLFNREKLWFEPGNKPLKVYNIKGVKIGAMICFDWYFPEVCRELTLQGMQVLAHPSNLVLPNCQRSMVTRCLENKIFAITANRTGTETRGEDNFTFTGASQITAPNGDVLESAPVHESHVYILEIDETLALNKNINDYNHLINEIRPEFYPNTHK